MDNHSPSMLRSTLIGGAVFGFLGGLPFVGALNVCCCSLVAAGGFLAAFLYSKECTRANVEFRPGGGATVGLVAGLFYAVASSIVGGIVRLASGPLPIDEILDQAESQGAPPEFVEMMGRVLHVIAAPLGVLIVFFLTLLLAAAFSTLGGLIGGAVFKVQPEPPAPPAAGAAPPPSIEPGS